MQFFSSRLPQQGMYNKCNFPYYRKNFSENKVLNEKDLKQYQFLESVSYNLFMVKIVGCIVLFLILMFGSNIYLTDKESRGDLFVFFKYFVIPLCIIVILSFIVDPIVQKNMMEIEKKASRPCINVFNKIYT
jgi:hypothetical protein